MRAVTLALGSLYKYCNRDAIFKPKNIQENVNHVQYIWDAVYAYICGLWYIMLLVVE